MGMFDNYLNITNKEHPDNRHVFCDIDEADEIVIGGTATHIFTLNFLYSKVCTRYEIFYVQSIEAPIIHIDSMDFGSPEVKEDALLNKSYIVVNLDPGDTLKFDPYRETFAQIKLYTKDGNIIYGDKNIIRLHDPVDNVEGE